MHSFARVGSFIMTAVFIYAVALQCNDPDALRWAAIYLSAAAARCLYLRGRLRWYIAAVIALIHKI